MPENMDEYVERYADRMMEHICHDVMHARHGAEVRNRYCDDDCLYVVPDSNPLFDNLVEFKVLEDGNHNPDEVLVLMSTGGPTAYVSRDDTGDTLMVLYGLARTRRSNKTISEYLDLLLSNTGYPVSAASNH